MTVWSDHNGFLPDLPAEFRHGWLYTCWVCVWLAFLVLCVVWLVIFLC